MPRPPDRGVWQEIRRRRVTKVVAAYLGASFGLVEVALFVAPGLPPSEVLVRAALGAIVLGFPVAVVLAWTYDLTPGGVVKTPDDGGPEEEFVTPSRAWLGVTIVGVVSGIVLEMLR